MTPLSPSRSRSAFCRLNRYDNGAGYSSRVRKEPALKIYPIPEEQSIEAPASQRTDESFDERMRLWHKGNALDLVISRMRRFANHR